MMSTVSEDPRPPMMTSTMRSGGSVRMTSNTLEITTSGRPPQYAPNSPRLPPMMSESVTAINGIMSTVTPP